MTGEGGSGLPSEMRELRHVVVVFADDSSVVDHPGAVRQATECPAYERSLTHEERHALWAAYADRLVAQGYRVSLDGASDRLVELLARGEPGDVIVAEVDGRGLASLLDVAGEAPPPDTLVAIALGGDRGSLLLFSPWSPGGWVSEESYDETSLVRLCERWTATRGQQVLADLPEWRRSATGDLVGAFTFRPAPRELTRELGARRLTRPVPYFQFAELRVDEDGPRLLLGNVGPTAAAAVTLAVDDGVSSRHLVAASPLEEPAWVEVPVSVRDGSYDVTVVGPDHFRRRYAGAFPSPARCVCEHFAGGDAWFPDLVLTVSHLTTLPVFFWLERRLGTRYGGARNERLLGPRRTATFREQPGARSDGWYDLRVTTSADPGWVQEYAGHLHAGNRPSLTL